MRRSKFVLAFATLMLLSGAAAADVKFAYVGEISGSIAVSGGNFRDGAVLAVEEVNAKGGILKQKIVLTLYDTQTNPGVARSQMQKAIDGEPYVILGPIFSGNVKALLASGLLVLVVVTLVAGYIVVCEPDHPYMFRTS